MDYSNFVIGFFMLVAVVIICILLVVEKKEKSSQLQAESSSATIKREVDAMLLKHATKLDKSLNSNANKVNQAFIESLEQITKKQLDEFSMATQSMLRQTLSELQVQAKQNKAVAKQYHRELSTITNREKADVIRKIDLQMAEIMIGYLAEIASSIDYQQQKDYIFSSLETHKDAIVRDINMSVK